MTNMAQAVLDGKVALPAPEKAIKSAAAGRIMDAREAAAAVYEAIPVAPALPGVRGKDHYTHDLPLISEPRIGILGWWQIEDDIAAVIVPSAKGIIPFGIGDDVVTVMFLFWDREGKRIRILNSLASVLADGVHWDLTLVRVVADRSARDTVYESARSTSIAQEIVAAILMVSSIVQALPALATTKTAPPRVRGKGKGRKSPKAVTAIHLPSVRYDAKAGTLSGTKRDGMPWHSVRGHVRRLTSGRTTWVRPYFKGDRTVGESTRPYDVA